MIILIIVFLILSSIAGGIYWYLTQKHEPFQTVYTTSITTPQKANVYIVMGKLGSDQTFRMATISDMHMMARTGTFKASNSTSSALTFNAVKVSQSLGATENAPTGGDASEVDTMTKNTDGPWSATSNNANAPTLKLTAYTGTFPLTVKSTDTTLADIIIDKDTTGTGTWKISQGNQSSIV
jgi:hypothetical protein